MQPVINSRFNRNRNQLNFAVKDFIANAVFLKDLEALVMEFQDFLRRHLAIPHAAVFLSHDTSSEMVNAVTGKPVEISNNILKLLESRPCSIGIDMIETHPMYSDVAPELLKLMVENGCKFTVPLIKAGQLVGLVLLPLPDHGADLSPDELKLLDQLSHAGLAFSNSVIYKNIADLKGYLEKRTVELTLEVEERQRFEEALRKSEEKHRLMAENIRDVIWTMDMALAFTYISPAAEKMQGWSTDEIMRLSLGQILTPASLEKVHHAMAENFRDGEKTGDFSRHVTLELEQFTPKR